MLLTVCPPIAARLVTMSLGGLGVCAVVVNQVAMCGTIFRPQPGE